MTNLYELEVDVMSDKEFYLCEERLSANDYIEFLSRTDLGSQYPKERFSERIATLVNAVSISIVARNLENKIIGVCFGITDFSYWLFISDLGVDRNYVKKGIGRALVNRALELAGGENNIIMFTCSHHDAIPFYEKIGMVKSADIMEYDRINWTPFTVGENEDKI